MYNEIKRDQWNTYVGLHEWAPDRERDKLRPRTMTTHCADYLQDIWQFYKQINSFK